MVGKLMSALHPSENEAESPLSAGASGLSGTSDDIVALWWRLGRRWLQVAVSERNGVAAVQGAPCAAGRIHDAADERELAGQQMRLSLKPLLEFRCFHFLSAHACLRAAG